MSAVFDHDAEIERLLALRRRALDDDFITDYDKLDDDGNKIEEVTIVGPDGTSNTLEVNLTHLFQSAPSTTGNVEMLVIEAELAAEGQVGNPHIPINADVLATAVERIDEKGLTPAWEVAADE